jgi:hypothetical protein
MSAGSSVRKWRSYDRFTANNKPMNTLENPAEISSRRPVFAWRALISVLISGAFLVLVVSGTVLFVSPPGRIANWTNWAMLGLRKHDWISVHVCFSVLFVVGAFIHAGFNWRPLLTYFKDRLTRRAGFRLEWLAALLICAGVYVGTRAAIPPFSSLLAFSDQVKESWDKPRDRAPIAHAELLTLAELAEKAGIDVKTAANRLQAKGMTGASSKVVVQDLAQKNQRSAQQIFQALTDPGERAGEREQQRHSAGFAGGKGAGGPGRKTLTEYCAGEGIDEKSALERLQSKGIKARPDQTLREIAVNNGYERPYELMSILGGK